VYSLAKRARKYFLGLTTITQDVADFLGSDYGKAVLNNSSIQILLKQHPAAIDKVAEVFYLSAGERNFLLSAGVGEGLFFAGTNHVAIQFKASKQEHLLITTNPQEVAKIEAEKNFNDSLKTIDERNQTSAPKQVGIANKYQNDEQIEQQTLAETSNDVIDPFDKISPVASTPETAPISRPGITPMPNPYSGITGDDSENYKSGTIILNERNPRPTA
ncbi:MAG: conjugal transfer ATP-binding protein TraC, partial [Patescibacteria group bacterium]|nr:conjugal transfer ATP-binding protein TraC [Patescibacteria group bacterium]